MDSANKRKKQKSHIRVVSIGNINVTKYPNGTYYHQIARAKCKNKKESKIFGEYAIGPKRIFTFSNHNATTNCAVVAAKCLILLLFRWYYTFQ